MIDIYSIKHFEPRHARMSNEARAAQFAPFSALNGFYERIREKEKIKKTKKILSSDITNMLNDKIMRLCKGSIIYITYYKNDEYIKEKCIIKKVDSINKMLVLENRTCIYFKNIIDIKIVNKENNYNV